MEIELKRTSRTLRKATTERLSTSSDRVFAVLTHGTNFAGTPPALPIWLSYAVSYLFIAIVWANHHHLPRYATEVTPRLMWVNFGHLFSVSLLPIDALISADAPKAIFEGSPKVGRLFED